MAPVWLDDLPDRIDHLGGAIGHRQITDASLVALAAHHRASVATLDRGLAAFHGPTVVLIPK